MSGEIDIQIRKEIKGPDDALINQGAGHIFKDEPPTIECVGFTVMKGLQGTDVLPRSNQPNKPSKLFRDNPA